MDAPLGPVSSQQGPVVHLKKELHYAHYLALSVATIAPFLTIFGFYGPIASAAGSGIIYVFIVAGIIAVANAVVFAHMSTLYPLAGGGYSVVRNVAGPFWGLIFLVFQLIFWFSATAVLAGIAAGFLAAQWPVLNPVVVSVGLIVLMFIMAMTNIRKSGVLSTVFLILEVAFILFWFAFGLTHIRVPVNTVLAFPPQALGKHGTLGGLIAFGALVTALPLAVFNTDGYEWATSFTEELTNFRVVRRALVTAALIGVFAYIIGMPLLTLVDPNFQTVANAAFPGAVVIKAILPGIAPVLIVYVAMSSFNAALANYLQAARLIFSGGRDQQFGKRASQFFSTVNASGVPVWATVIWIIPSLLLAVLSSLQSLFSFTSVVLIIDYILLSLAAVWFYVKAGRPLGIRDGAFRWFPLVPAIVIVFGVLILVLQPVSQILISLAIFAAAFILALGVFKSPRLNDQTQIVENSTNAGSTLIPSASKAGDS